VARLRRFRGKKRVRPFEPLVRLFKANRGERVPEFRGLPGEFEGGEDDNKEEGENANLDSSENPGQQFPI